jgi:hypothetical protein
MELIQKRGFYNASELDAAIAAQNVRGRAMLADAGEELIGNTFVSFTQFAFYKNEPAARAVLNAAVLLAHKTISNDFALGLAIFAAERTYNMAKDGQTLFSKTYLYKLKWNEEIAAQFYNVWNNAAAFDAMDFELEFVGMQSNSSTILFALDGADSAIKKVEIRSIDKIFAELQQKYDVFKPKVPILSAPNPITAQIGMKEGLKGGEKFEVLEMTIDSKTERTKYVRIGTTKVNKKMVWDNRYNAGDAPEIAVNDKDGNPITATHFDKMKKAQPGMLLKQIK